MDKVGPQHLCLLVSMHLLLASMGQGRSVKQGMQPHGKGWLHLHKP